MYLPDCETSFFAAWRKTQGHLSVLSTGKCSMKAKVAFWRDFGLMPAGVVMRDSSPALASSPELLRVLVAARNVLLTPVTPLFDDLV